MQSYVCTHCLYRLHKDAQGIYITQEAFMAELVITCQYNPLIQEPITKAVNAIAYM